MEELDTILGGPQGSGLETAMNILSRAFTIAGYGFIAEREYFSNIVGRHSYIHMRISSRRLPRSLRYPVKLLVASDAETVFTHYMDLSVDSIVVYNSDDFNKSINEIPSMEEATRSRIIKLLHNEGLEDYRVGKLLEHASLSRRTKAILVNFQRVLGELSRLRGVKPQ